jgi:energy-coupling factor transport system ATP-binding protein
VAVLGHNGSGKSTLARLVNGLLQPKGGTISVFGRATSDEKTLFDIKKDVGIVFQNPDNQTVASIVEDDVAFGPENVGVPREQIGERIRFALQAVGMEEYAQATTTRLSGGQKQRIAIAGVLALMPKILVLDESTAMLDPKGRKEVLAVADKLNKEHKVTVINITHYMDEVVRADKVFVVNDGEIVLSGTPEEIFKEKDLLKNCGLELPLAAIVADKLIERGVKLPQGILTEEQLAEELCALKRKI